MRVLVYICTIIALIRFVNIDAISFQITSLYASLYPKVKHLQCYKGTPKLIKKMCVCVCVVNGLCVKYQYLLVIYM